MEHWCCYFDNLLAHTTPQFPFWAAYGNAPTGILLNTIQSMFNIPPTSVQSALSSLQKWNMKWLYVSYPLCSCYMPVLFCCCVFFFSHYANAVALCVGGPTAHQTSCALALKVPASLSMLSAGSLFQKSEEFPDVFRQKKWTCRTFYSFWVLLLAVYWGFIKVGFRGASTMREEKAQASVIPALLWI